LFFRQRRVTLAVWFLGGQLVPTTWLEELIGIVNALAPEGSFLSMGFVVRGLIAVVLVSLICGAVGSLVVGNRMAFFSDALAHCAFAAVTMGLLMGLVFQADRDSGYYDLGLLLIMVAVGVAVGVGIGYVREQTGLASDTVIGVFFAGAIGFGAVFYKTLTQFRYADVEAFLFGNPISVGESDLALLIGLGLVETVILVFLYNQMVFTSFNPSLARSRNVPLRLCNYLFIVLLAMIVNLSVKTVGTLLINAMLVVPAATASNLCRNMRQLFWATTGLSLGVSLLGYWLSHVVTISLEEQRSTLTFGPAGLIVVLSVLLFFVSMLVGPLLRGRRA